MFKRARRLAVTTAVLSLAGIALVAPATASPPADDSSTTSDSGESLIQGPLVDGPLISIDGLLEPLQLGQFQQ